MKNPTKTLMKRPTRSFFKIKRVEMTFQISQANVDSDWIFFKFPKHMWIVIGLFLSLSLSLGFNLIVWSRVKPPFFSLVFLILV